MKERYSEDENWFSVRFSDERHFSYESQKKIRIIRKSSQRYCQNCLQETNESIEKNLKKKHAWAAVNHNFKSDIRLYDVSSNTNEKMSQRIYIDQILKLVVKSCLDRDDDFCLKEDDDSNHDTDKNNIVRKWKQDHELKYYFNCVSSSDLSSIENCWQSSKQHIRKFSHWDEIITIELIYEKWDTISQNFINNKMTEMSKRLQAMIDENGAMTSYW
jgi:glutaredoxin-related protein